MSSPTSNNNNNIDSSFLSQDTETSTITTDNSVPENPSERSPEDWERAQYLLNFVQNAVSNLVSETRVQEHIQNATDSNSPTRPTTAPSILRSRLPEVQLIQHFANVNLPTDMLGGLDNIEAMVQAAGLDNVEAAANTATARMYSEAADRSSPTFRAGSRQVRRKVQRRSAQKEVVLDLMSELPDTQNEEGHTMKNFKCSKCNKRISFRSNTGWTNGFSHLKKCHDVDDLMEEKNQAENIGLSLLDKLMSKQSELVQHLYSFIKLVTEANLPLTFCENKFYQDLTRAFPKLNYRKVRYTINRLVTIVKKKIRREMKSAKRGSIMYDAWTRFNSHYIGVLVTYVDPDTGDVKSRLVGCTPLTSGQHVNPGEKLPDDVRVAEIQVPGENGEDGGQTESFVFTAEAYAEHIKNVFQELGIDFDDWVVCQVTDNATVMRRAAKILKIYIVGCKSHGLHLAIIETLPLSGSRLQVSPNREFVGTIHSCNTTMKNARQQGKAGAVLRALTKLRPKVMVPQRWSSIFYMLMRWNRINPELRTTYANRNTNLTMDISEDHQDSVDSLLACMRPLQFATKTIQEKHLALNRVRRILDALITDVMPPFRSSHGFHFNYRKVMCNRANPLYSRKEDMHFERAICKILNKEEHLLIPEEKATLGKMEKVAVEVHGEQEQTDEMFDIAGSAIEALKNAYGKDDKSGSGSAYYDASFIGGSSAEIERVFTMSSGILTTDRSSMTFGMFESLMILKYNSDMWDIKDVADAYHGRVPNESGRDLPILNEEYMEEEMEAEKNAENINEFGELEECDYDVEDVLFSDV